MTNGRLFTCELNSQASLKAFLTAYFAKEAIAALRWLRVTGEHPLWFQTRQGVQRQFHLLDL